MVAMGAKTEADKAPKASARRQAPEATVHRAKQRGGSGERPRRGTRKAGRPSGSTRNPVLTPGQKATQPVPTLQCVNWLQKKAKLQSKGLHHAPVLRQSQMPGQTPHHPCRIRKLPNPNQPRPAPSATTCGNWGSRNAADLPKRRQAPEGGARQNGIPSIE